MLAGSERARMDAHQAKVLGVLEAAEKETSPGLLPWLDAPELVQEQGAVRQARELYVHWTDARSPSGKRRWVEEGHRDDGKAYLVEDWMGLGDTIAQGAAYASQQHYESGYWKAGAAALTQSGEDLAHLPEDVAERADPTRWSSGAKVAAGVGVGLLGLLALNAFLGNLRALIGGGR